MMEFVWVIPLVPLLSFLILLLFGKRMKNLSPYIGTGLLALTFIFAAVILAERIDSPTYRASFEWLKVGDIHLAAGVEVNQLNALMLVIVSLVSVLVHMYSIGYMKGDGRIATFYAYLGLFTFAMLGLVLSPNLLQLYVFWELVGLGSFLLIGFYFYKESARDAAKKAFIMTRIGDVGLLIGIILLFWQTGSFEMGVIFAQVEAGAVSDGMITLTAILIFIGAIGKSGQFPLHTWLPDAMEGPTPVSALIHAATMVAAGVYLVAMMFPLYLASEAALLTVAVIGAFTAIFAALIAIGQNDIKRILAYSTVSQLGYMMLALGSAGYVAGVFHLTTHAFFKALLFLAAGSVIHAVKTQDILKMGGLFSKLRLTGPLFLIGTLALTGFPLLSGFFSKDEILISAWNAGHPVLFALALATAVLTAFYMFRLFFLVFTGPSKSDAKIEESPRSMTIPMMVLGVLAIFGGYLNTPWFGEFLGNWLSEGNPYVEAAHTDAPGWVAIAAVLAFLAGSGGAYLLFGRKGSTAPQMPGLLVNKFYVDEFYLKTAVPLVRGIGHALSWVDRYIVQGFGSLVSGLVYRLSARFADAGNGQMQLYGAVAFIGLAVILVIFALTGGYMG